MNLNAKTVLITGASGGLGVAVSQCFAESGANAIGVSRNSPGTIQADLSSLAAAQALVDQVHARHDSIDVLVHLVGGFAGGKAVQETDDATLDRMFEINFRSAFHIIRAVLPAMRSRKSGCILAIASRAAIDPQPGIGAYAASKAALVSLLRTVALENKDAGISANVILPATIDTPANRASMPSADFTKWVSPADVGALLVRLAANPSVSGDVISI